MWQTLYLASPSTEAQVLSLPDWGRAARKVSCNSLQPLLILTVLSITKNILSKFFGL